MEYVETNHGSDQILPDNLLPELVRAAKRDLDPNLLGRVDSQFERVLGVLRPRAFVFVVHILFVKEVATADGLVGPFPLSAHDLVAGLLKLDYLYWVAAVNYKRVRGSEPIGSAGTYSLDQTLTQLRACPVTV